MMNPNKMMETWLSLMTEAAQGSGEARETVRTLTGAPVSPDEMLRLMTRFLPAGVGPTQARAFNESLEEYWKMIGVVPRYRYLELLERNEQLRRQLEEADRMIEQLQPAHATAAIPQEQARKMLDLWGSMLQETMKAQQSIMQTWTSAGSATESSTDTSETPSETSEPSATSPSEGSEASKPRRKKQS